MTTLNKIEIVSSGIKGKVSVLLNGQGIAVCTNRQAVLVARIAYRTLVIQGQSVEWIGATESDLQLAKNAMWSLNV